MKTLIGRTRNVPCSVHIQECEHLRELRGLNLWLWASPDPHPPGFAAAANAAPHRSPHRGKSGMLAATLPFMSEEEKIQVRIKLQLLKKHNKAEA
jgi:hypothetical protein